MAVSLRIAKKADLPFIVEVYNSTVPSRMVTADLEPVSVESKAGWFGEHDKSTRPLWIIDWNGQPAGWMSFSSFYGRPAYNGTVEVSIYLSPDFHRKGIGSKCLQSAIEIAPTLQVHTLLGFIFGHNAASIDLFLKFGFELYGKLPAVANMDGVMCDLLIMGRKV